MKTYRIRFKEWDEEGNSAIRVMYITAINPEQEFWKVWHDADVKILTIKKV